MSSEHNPSFDQRRTAAEDALADFLALRERGEKIDIDEYCQRHPHLATELRLAHGELFGLFEELERLGRSAVEQPRAAEAGASEALSLGPINALSNQILERLTGRKLPSQRYRVEESVARGGMGEVLRVWDEDLRRSLAMKVILDDGEGSALLREQRLSRFLEEAQITGQLDHPGVVPIHELGVDGAGHVYFTMKLVRGRTLKDVFDEARQSPGSWTTTRLIEILLRICEAMSFAHAKGVIHRDLKPANIMVGRFGEVYVMDWGLARVMGRVERHELRAPVPAHEKSETIRTHRRDLADSDPSSPLRTLDGHIVGTPAYMSPEQSRGLIEEIGVQTDVYSVGAILYHMLTNAMPYVGPSESPSNRSIWLRVQAGPPASIASFARAVPAELEAICEKAMAREVAQRYASMEALAADLRAFIEGRVVGAYEGGALAELRKWVHRNRAPAAGFSLAFLFLVGGLGSISYVQANNNRAITQERDLAVAAKKVATAQKTIAESEARKSEEAMDFLEGIFGSVRSERGGSSVTVAEVLENAARALDEVKDRDPEVQATLHELLGISYTSLGRSNQAVTHMQACLELREGLQAPDPHELWRAKNALGVSLRDAGKPEEGALLLREALAMITEQAGPLAWDTLICANNLAVALAYLQDFQGALEVSQDAAKKLRQHFGPEESATIQTESTYASALYFLGQHRQAMDMLADIVERCLRVFGPNHGLTLAALGNYVYSLEQLGDVWQASALSDGLLERFQHSFGKDHNQTLVCADTLILLKCARWEYAQAAQLARDTLRRKISVNGENSVHALETLGLLGRALVGAGEQTEAEEVLWQSYEGFTNLEGDHSQFGLRARLDLAWLFALQARFEEAHEVLAELAQIHERTASPNLIDYGRLLWIRGLALAGEQRWTEAEQSLRAAAQEQERRYGPDHPDGLQAQVDLGRVLAAQQQPDAARDLWQSLLPRLIASFGAEHARVREVVELLTSPAAGD